MNNEKEKVTIRNATNQNSEIWPLIQVPAEKHENNPVIGVIREKIHSLVDEMDQAPEQSDETFNEQNTRSSQEITRHS